MPEEPGRSGELAVLVNGQAFAMGAGATVADVVEALGCGERGVAVAVNSQLLRRAQWTAAGLQPGDRVEVLHAVAGG
jgi:sulfur carrier protein